MLKQITWLVWGALHTPPQSGHRLVDASEASSKSLHFSRYHSLAILLAVVFGFILFRFILTIELLTMTLASGFVTLLIIAAILILLSGTLNGARWAFQVAQVIYQDMQDGRYELMTLSPLGSLGAIWLITHQQTKTNRVIEFFQTVGLALFLALIVVGLIFIYTLLTGPPTLFLSQPIIGSVLAIGFVILAFYIDYVQAIVIGHLSGIYLATFAKRENYAEAGAIVILTASQIATYLIAALTAFLGIIFSSYLFQETNDAALLLIILVFIGTAYGFREFAIRVLWRAILTRFRLSDTEISQFP